MILACNCWKISKFILFAHIHIPEREQRAESREQRAESREQRAERGKQNI
jgi:hypothetical protein